MIDNKWVDVKRHDSDAHAAGPAWQLSLLGNWVWKDVLFQKEGIFLCSLNSSIHHFLDFQLSPSLFSSTASAKIMSEPIRIAAWFEFPFWVRHAKASMLRDDRRGDDRRDEKKDHKDRGRKRKHEAPRTFVVFFTGFLDAQGDTVCFPWNCWAIVEMQRHAQVEGESANDDRKAQLHCKKFRCCFCSQLGANHLMSLKCGQ